MKPSPVLLAAVLAACSLTACSGSAAAPPVNALDGTACSGSGLRPPAGMQVLALSRLPAQAVGTLRLIARGGPYPYAEDDTVFGNYQQLLPREPIGYYHEFTVAAAGARSRGPRRIVTGAGGQDYFSPDHYVSFAWIACGPAGPAEASAEPQTSA